MKNIQWAAVLAQVCNLAAVYAQFSSPHTAAIIGGALAIVQAVAPSVVHGINAAAVAGAAQ